MTLYDEEKVEYSEKLEAQIKTLDNILNVNSCGLITPEVDSKLRELKEKAVNYKRKLDKNEFEIAIVGLEKAGKSTFANALMGNDILPSKEQRCTYTSTRICAGDDKATVRFFTRDEFNKKLRSQLSTLKIENAESYSFEALELSAYERMFDKLDSQIRELYQSNINEDIRMCLEFKSNLLQYIGKPNMEFSGDQLTSDELKRFIEDPKYALAVKDISIYSSQLSQMPNAVIYDVPGFDSPTQIHREQTVESMRRVDAIMLIASAFKPSFTGPIVDLFSKNSDYDGVKFGSKMFVFANMADRATDLDHNMGVIRGDLSKYRIMSESNFDRIVSGSAYAFLEKEGKVTPVGAKEDLEKKGLDDGIKQIFDKLNKYNETERFEILKQRINKIQTDLFEVFQKVSEEYSEQESNTIISDSIGLADELTSKKEPLKKALDRYYVTVKSEHIDGNTPISDAVKDTIINEITVDNYGVTDNEYTDADITEKAKSVSGQSSPEAIEVNLREKKRKVIYNKFSSGIINLANEKHQSYDNGMVELFLDAFDVTSSNANYKAIKEGIENFINEQKNTTDEYGYYKSLIERFSIDLFEAMIYLRLGSSDRWNKFKNEMSSFKSLSVYDETIKDEDTFKNQPLCNLILFQTKQRVGTYATKAKYDDLLSILGTAVNFIPGGTITKMLGKAVLDPKVFEIVKSQLSRLNRNSSESQVETMLKNATQKVTCEDGLTEESYNEYFKGKSNKEKDSIIADINTDITNLHDVLNTIVIKAICIEKAFLALELGTLNNIKEALDGVAFRQFIKKYAALIKMNEFAHLEEEQQKRITKKRLLEDIKQMLKLLENKEVA